MIIFYSFDIVRDSLGSDRKDFPHTVYFVAGTQVSFHYFSSIMCYLIIMGSMEQNLSDLNHSEEIVYFFDYVLCSFDLF